MDDAVPQPSSILEAAQLASRASQSRPERQMPFSRIPLIIHQTAASARLDTWRPQVVPWVEQWLRHAHSPRPNESMAYFFWDNSGILDLVRSSERDLVNDFMDLFAPVERADIFRVLVCKWFGGVVRQPSPCFARHPIPRPQLTLLSCSLSLPPKSLPSVADRQNFPSTLMLTPSLCVTPPRGFNSRTLAPGPIQTPRLSTA